MGPASEAFQLHDRFFCSILASTYPNRHYMWAAQGGGFKNNEIPADTLGHQWETIFDRALAQGRQRALLQLRPAVRRAVRRARRRLDAARSRTSTRAPRPGRCRTSRFVDPPFRDGGGGNGVSADDHPHGDIRLGQAFMSDVVHAFMESPQYKRGALFIVYDEWGGFFDHVAPPRVPDDRENNATRTRTGAQMGFRIPALTVSPFVTRRRGLARDARVRVDPQADLVQVRPRHLNRRHRYALQHRPHDASGTSPRMEPPQLPDPGVVATAPCSAGGGRGFPGARARARAARARSRTTSPCWRPAATSSGSASTSPRPRTSSLYRNPDSSAARSSRPRRVRRRRSADDRRSLQSPEPQPKGRARSAAPARCVPGEQPATMSPASTVIRPALTRHHWQVAPITVTDS